MTQTFLQAQSTPNPNAVKFRFARVLAAQPRTYASTEDARNDPLALELLGLPGVESLYYHQDFLTVTKSASCAWNHLLPEIRDILETRAAPASHDPSSDSHRGNRTAALSDDADKLQQILHLIETDIRPALVSDGGGLDVVSLHGHTLTIRYLGACGNCPSSTAGTLRFIEDVLKRSVDPDLRLELA